ncbi:MAG: hypothetical protein ACRD0J_11220 [Acidimicrobiales bacterium]
MGPCGDGTIVFVPTLGPEIEAPAFLVPADTLGTWGCLVLVEVVEAADQIATVVLPGRAFAFSNRLRVPRSAMVAFGRQAA